MVVPRFARLALIAGLLASLVFSGTVSAEEESTSVTGDWGSMGVWGTYADYYARWQVNAIREGGVTKWSIEKFDMDAVLRNGMDCTSLICQNWASSAKVEFLNAAGGVVATRNLPSDNCYSVFQNPRNRHFSRCQRAGFGLSLSVTKVRLTWTVSVQNRNGFWSSPWQAVKTVPLS